MNVNVYVEKWCHTEYDPTQEDFYVANARYVVNRGWLRGTFVNIAVSIVASLVFFAITHSVFAIGYAAGVFTIAYILYGLNNYWFDNIFRAVLGYVFTLIFLIWTWFKLPVALQIIFSIIGILLFISSSFYLLKRTFKERAAFNKLSDEQEDYFNKKDTEEFYEWKNEFYSHFDWYESETNNNYVNEYDSPPDPLVQKAKELFEGSLTSYTALKKRYRQLAKKYHPDVGGDEELFKRIVAFYEDHKDMFNEAA